MKKRVVLIGAIYYRNLGDAALCVAAQNLLSDKFNVTLLDIYGRTKFPTIPPVNVENCRKEYNSLVRRLWQRKILLKIGIVPVDKRKRIMVEHVENQLREEIERDKPSAIVFAGGALIKGVFINSIVRIIEVARYYSVPVVFNAVGIDTVMYSSEWRKISKVFQDEIVRYISVRDSYDFLCKRFPKLLFHETFDPAICANRFFKSATVKKGVGLGIMLSYQFDLDMQTAFWSRLIQRMNTEKRDWWLFTNGAPADQNYAAYLLEENHEDTNRLVPCPGTPEDLYYNISAFEAIISMRLHSHILAYSAAVPSVAISWDQKINDFFSKIGKPQNCLNFSTSVDTIMCILNKSLCDTDFFKDQLEHEQQVDKNIVKISNTIINNSVT